MSTFVIILLTVAVFLYVAGPLRKQRRVEASASGNEHLDELQARRDTTYAMLKELEFDHESGLLADEDFMDLEDRYKGKAISILKDLDVAEHSVERGADSADEIEREVLRLRGVAGPPGGETPTDQGGEPLTDAEDEIERQVLKLRRVAGPKGDGVPAGTDHGSPPETEDEIERQILELRRVAEQPVADLPTTDSGEPQARPEDEIERRVNALRQGRGRFCTQCGTRAGPTDRFCADCGASLSRGGK
jgi:hypothetical protein